MNGQFFLSSPTIDYPTPPLKSERLSMIFEESGLISSSRIKLALKDRLIYPHLSFGEILVLRGWIKPKTVIFFNRDWSQVIQQKEKRRLGEYLQQAALLNPEHINSILQEQQKRGSRFGEIAIEQGLIRSMTIEFFLNYLYPEQFNTATIIERGTEDIDRFTKLTVSSETYLLDSTYKQYFTSHQTTV
jgi:hypothetical protein